MRSKKAEGFDYQNFEKEALWALYEGKPLEEALGPLLKRIVEAGLQGEMQAHLEEGKSAGVKNPQRQDEQDSSESIWSTSYRHAPDPRSVFPGGL